MKKSVLFLLIALPHICFAGSIEKCLTKSINSDEFNSCIERNIIDIDINKNEPDYDCSVLRNYRDRDGNFTCPTENYDVCLKEYGPRLPPPYFEFVKHWCWCNCVYDPDDIY